MKGIAIWLLLGAAAFGQTARLSDVRPYSVKNTPIIAPNGDSPVLIDTGVSQWYTVTVSLDGFSYSANFHETKRLRPSEWIVGDEIPATIEGNNIVLRNNQQKAIKGRIVRRERIPTALPAASQQSASR